MAVGLAAAQAEGILNAIGNATNYTAPTAFWIKMHIGDPGAAGTSNPAVNTTRKQVSFGAATGGAIANDTAVTWTTGEVTTTEDYTHWTGWTASAAGTFIGSGTVTAPSAVAGQEYILAIGDVDLTLTVATT
jgi:hypothetical protein